MKKHVSRRLFLGGIASAVTVQAARADAPLVSLRPELRGPGFHKKAVTGAQAILDGSGLTGSVGFAVADATTGAALEQHNAAVAAPPASVAKAITALYALEMLGVAYRFQTRLLMTGEVQNGILQGDLILAGGGDPTLDTDNLAALAAELKAAGITEVRGDFQVYDGALPYRRTIDAGQPEHLGYSPAVSGLALNFNRVHFEWKPQGKAWTVTMEARTKRFRPAVRVARMAIEDRSFPVYTYSDGGGVDNWTVARGALGRGGARWLPVRRPARYAGEVFAILARSHGIVLSAPKVRKSLDEARVIATHRSEPLRIILRDMLKYSTNLTAEMVGMTATRSHIGQTTDLTRSAEEMSRWARVAFGMDTIAMRDHSGLNDASRMSAGDMVKALARAHKAKMLRPILKPIALRDEKGRPQKDHPVQVAAKTGTLNFVSGLAGYLTATDGTELVFAIFAADTERRAKIPKADRESPRGARSWNTRAKRLHEKLLERWGVLYGA